MKKLLLALCLFFVSLSAFAVLTPAQQATLKADILADPVLSAYPSTTDGAWDIAAKYNKVSAPAFYVWRTDVPADEIMRNGMDWTQVDNLSVGKARIWDWLTKLGTINASKTNVRAGIDACWVGTAPMLAVRTAIYLHLNRAATRFEKLFATGTGTTVSPATMTLEGSVNYQDVEAARNSQ